MQVFIITVFRLIIVIVGLLVVKDLMYLFSPYTLRENINGVNIPLFIFSSIIYLIILAFLWTAPRTILKLSKTPLPLSENEVDHSFYVQLAIFCIGLYLTLWTGSSLIDSLLYFLFSGEVGNQRGAYLLHLMTMFSIVALLLLVMYKSKTIARWFYKLR